MDSETLLLNLRKQIDSTLEKAKVKGRKPKDQAWRVEQLVKFEKRLKNLEKRLITAKEKDPVRNSLNEKAVKALDISLGGLIEGILTPAMDWVKEKGLGGIIDAFVGTVGSMLFNVGALFGV